MNLSLMLPSRLKSVGIFSPPTTLEVSYRGQLTVQTVTCVTLVWGVRDTRSCPHLSRRNVFALVEKVE